MFSIWGFSVFGCSNLVFFTRFLFVGDVCLYWRFWVFRVVIWIEVIRFISFFFLGGRFLFFLSYRLVTRRGGRFRYLRCFEVRSERFFGFFRSWE